MMEAQGQMNVSVALCARMFLFLFFPHLCVVSSFSVSDHLQTTFFICLIHFISACAVFFLLVKKKCKECSLMATTNHEIENLALHFSKCQKSISSWSDSIITLQSILQSIRQMFKSMVSSCIFPLMVFSFHFHRESRSNCARMYLLRLFMQRYLTIHKSNKKNQPIKF